MNHPPGFSSSMFETLKIVVIVITSYHVSVNEGKLEFRMQYEDKEPVNLVAPNVINDGREHSVTLQKFPNYAQIKVKLKI